MSFNRLLCVYYSDVAVTAAPQVSNLQALPELRVDVQEQVQWWHAVGKVEQTRPGLQTLVVCAIITAMHSPLCESLASHLCGYSTDQLQGVKRLRFACVYRAFKMHLKKV